MSNGIQEVFGQFAVLLEDGPKMFADLASAELALAEFENGAEQREDAAAFCAAVYPKLAGKAVKGKSNVVVAYLAWVEAGRPEAAVEETEESSDVATTDEEAADQF